MKTIINFALPKALYAHPNVKKIFFHQDSCVLHKKLSESLLDQAKLSTSHCIVFVVKGRVEVKTYEGESVSCVANEMLFMPRDTYLISDFVMKDEGIEVFLVFFDHELVVKFLSSKLNRPGKSAVSDTSICKLTTSRKVVHYFNALEEIYSEFENSKEMLELKVLEFLHLVYLDNQSAMINTLYSSEHQKRKRSIESIMLEHFDKNLSVADFANLSGRSVSSFNRDFRRKYDLTPKQWLISKRMEKGDELLRAGVTVTECALSVGYSNVSHFIKAYKQAYGNTPKVINKNRL